MNDLTTDIARFNQAAYNVTLALAPSSRKIKGLVFGDASTITSAFTITTSAGNDRLGIGAAGIMMHANVGDPSPVIVGNASDQGVRVDADQTWTNNSTALLKVGSITNASTTPHTLTLTGSGNISTHESGSITDNATGTLSLVADLGGTFTIGTGTNNYRGATTVNRGTLRINGTVPDTSAVTIAAGAILDTTAHTSYTIPAGKTYSFGIDGATSGSAGKIAAAGLNISSAKVVLAPVGTLDDPVYVLATYTSLTGTSFAAPLPTVPSGYNLVYNHNGGTQIALVLTGGYPLWQQNNGATGQTPDLDHDGDGVPNGVEYFVGGTTGFTALPGVVGDSVIWTKDAAFLGTYGTTYKLQTSTDLTGWTDVLPGDPRLISTGSSVGYNLLPAAGANCSSAWWSPRDPEFFIPFPRPPVLATCRVMTATAKPDLPNGPARSLPEQAKADQQLIHKAP